MKRTIVIILAVIALSAFSHAQKIILKSGALDFLRGQEKISVVFDYSNLSVGKYEKEDDYVKAKVTDYNKSEAGKGDKWKDAWFGDRSSRYEPKFEELFNTYLKAKNLQCDRDASGTAFVMNVHTVFIEPGFNVGVTRKSASINVVVTFTEAASGKDMAVVTLDNVPGRDAMGFDFDTGYRLEEAYAKLGKSLAGFLVKKL